MDAVQEGKTGLLVESENVSELATAMQEMITNHDLRQKLGRQGREWADQFTWDKIAAAQERVYINILNARPTMENA